MEGRRRNRRRRRRRKGTDIRRTKLDGKHIGPLRGSPLRGVSSPNWRTARLTLNYTMDRVETDEVRTIIGQIPRPMITIRTDFSLFSSSSLSSIEFVVSIDVDVFYRSFLYSKKKKKKRER